MYLYMTLKDVYFWYYTILCMTIYLNITLFIHDEVMVVSVELILIVSMFIC